MKVSNKKWHTVVPVVDQSWTGPGRVTEYRIAETINAPTYERAIEEAEHIAKKHVKRYFEDSGVDINIEEIDTRNYKLRGSSLWRVQEESTYKGTRLSKWV